MTTDFQIAKGDLNPRIRQTLTFPSAISLYGASVKFMFSKPGATPVERDATIVSPDVNSSGASSAATTATVEYAWQADDVAAEGVYRFQWVFTLADASKLHFPPKSPTVDDPDRVFQTFEVTPTL